MTRPVFLATLGQRPEALTMALDVLHPRYHYAEVCILHTHPEQSGIAAAYAALMDELAVYAHCEIKPHEITMLDGTALLDITSKHEGEIYYRQVLATLLQYRTRYIPIHLLVAGGRKAMSIYATLAASVVFGEHDRVWTVLADQTVMQAGMFHAPMGQFDTVQVVELPVQYSQLLPAEMARRGVEGLLARQSPRQMFLASLTPTEREIAEALSQQPYASNELLGELLSRAPKTVENYLGRIYGKLMSHFDLQIEANRKRQVLVDVMTEQV